MPLIDLGIILAKIAAVIGALLGIVSYTVLAERKISAIIQERVGPNRVGIPFIENIPLIGFFTSMLALGQPIADAMKFMFKEEFTPSHVNKFYFWLAPALTMMPALITVSVIPFGGILDLKGIFTFIQNVWPSAYDLLLQMNNGALPDFTRAVVADVNVGILMVFAVTSLSVYGIVLAGWSSNSKFPFLGGIRSSAQLISYELSMGLSVIPVFLIVGNLNMGALIEFQKVNGWLVLPFMAETFNWKSYLFALPLGLSFLIFMVSSFAETNRLPFDLPESETELVGGYHTEYGAMKFALFFLGEYVAMIVTAALMVTLFFGGWTFPFLPTGEGNLLWGAVSILSFLFKLVFFIVFFIWIRWTLPRFRYDQLMNLGWKIFLPLALANIVFTALLVALVR